MLELYDKKYNYLSAKKQIFGKFESLVLTNHRTIHLPYALHHYHNQDQEENIKDFVNRESLSYLEDLNADTISTVNQVAKEWPLLLCFVDLDL